MIRKKLEARRSGVQSIGEVFLVLTFFQLYSNGFIIICCYTQGVGVAMRGRGLFGVFIAVRSFEILMWGTLING